MVKKRGAKGYGCDIASVCDGTKCWFSVVLVSDIVTTKRRIWDLCLWKISGFKGFEN